jgi:putative nucleotidyltransferase with HDIG domain
MIVDRDRVKSKFAEYTAHYDIEDTKVRLKVEHTYRVAELAEKIARSLDLNEGDVDIAWLLGMLHDIGRFEQLRRFNTFIDSKSINHAKLSADLLFGSQCPQDMSDEEDSSSGDGYSISIRDFIDSDEEDSVIEKAIRLHNVFILPSDLSERELLFCNLLRDADKIDILKVNCDIPREEIYDKPVSVIVKESISPLVYEDAISCRNVDRKNVVTVVDSLVTQISFVYGLVFPESYRLTADQGYLDKLLDFKSENRDTNEKMLEIRNAVKKYITNSCAASV